VPQPCASAYLVQIGVETPREIAEADFSEFGRFLQVHVDGTFLLTRSVSAAMKRQEPRPVGSSHASRRGTTRGSIVVLGSGSSFVATPSMVQYTTAKHAVIGLTKNAGERALTCMHALGCSSIGSKGLPRPGICLLTHIILCSS
jgi:NAD(P)-dependent dehydrogenase (short-subunit alcohol dehydrogenase family)